MCNNGAALSGQKDFNLKKFFKPVLNVPNILNLLQSPYNNRFVLVKVWKFLNVFVLKVKKIFYQIFNKENLSKSFIQFEQCLSYHIFYYPCFYNSLKAQNQANGGYLKFGNKMWTGFKQPILGQNHFWINKLKTII